MNQPSIGRIAFSILTAIPLAFAALALGAIAAALLARGRRPGWQALGVVYAGLPSIAIVWIRAQPGDGLAALAWMSWRRTRRLT